MIADPRRLRERPTWREAIDRVGDECGKPDAVACLVWCTALGMGAGFVGALWRLGAVVWGLLF